MNGQQLEEGVTVVTRADKMDCSPEPAYFVWMDHCYFRFEVNLETKVKELTRDIQEGALHVADGLHTAVCGQVRVKEEPIERPIACGSEDEVLAMDVWMDHNYNRAIAESEQESHDLNTIFVKGEPMDADENDGSDVEQSDSVCGQVPVKEEPIERPIACGSEDEVLPMDVWMDHNYNRAIAESEQESRDLNTIFVKGEPIDADENDGTDVEQSDSVSGQVRVKEEPIERPIACGSEDKVLPMDVWMDHNYNQAIAESEQESRDFNEVSVKVEPIDADETDSHNGELLISANDASPAEGDLDFAFASCKPTAMSRGVARVLQEHNYVSRLVPEASTQDVGDLAETDPLSLDQQPSQFRPNAEDQSSGAEGPSEDFRALLCAINDDEPNRRRAGRRNVDTANSSTSSELPVNKDNLPIFQCRLCHESFDSYPDFDCHFSLWHTKSTNDSSYLCQICGWDSESSQELVAHMNWMHDCQINVSKVLRKSFTNMQSDSETFLAEIKKPLCCRACREKFECETDLKIHLLLDRCRLSCVECKRGFACAGSLHEHQSEAHTDAAPGRKRSRNSHTCRMCNQSFMHPGRLLRHLMLQNCDEKLTCDFCHNAFLTSSALTAHQESAKCTKRSPCRTLEACWLLADGVQSKLEASTNSKTGFYSCHICEEMFRCNWDLTRHFTSNHIDFIADDFCCRRREYEFKTSKPVGTFSSDIKPAIDTNLNSVEKYPRQASEVNHSCELCKKKFKSKPLLQCHKETHKSKQDVTCVECERCFTLTSNLPKHLKRCHKVTVKRAQPLAKELPVIKTYERSAKNLPVRTYVPATRKSPLPSPECGERLATCAGPESPTESRSRAKAFTCASCQQTVSTKRELRSHLMSHVTERNFGCLECKKYFTYAIDFIQHTKRCSEKFVRNDKTIFKISPVEKRKRKRRARGKERNQMYNGKPKGNK